MTLRALLIMTLPVLLLSAVAANFFFGAGSDIDPEVVAEKARQRALATAEEAARAGGPAETLDLALLLRAEPDPEARRRGLDLLRSAARDGHPAAQAELGRIHQTGDGVRQDLRKAVEWYRLAARPGGDAAAQFRLGDLHFRGHGVVRDPVAALELFERAAQVGHPVARYMAGRMYRDGWGVQADPVTAYKWLKLASADAARVAAHDKNFDPAGEFRRLVAGMNRNQIERAERLIAATPKGP